MNTIDEPSREVSTPTVSEFAFLFKRPWFWRVAALLAGIVVPMIAFALTFKSGSPLVLFVWQSGELDQYTNQMLRWPSVGAFYPILIYPMVCCAAAVLGGQKWIDRIWVRIGIYSGVLVALQFHLMLFSTAEWGVWTIVLALLFLLIGFCILAVALALWFGIQWACVSLWRRSPSVFIVVALILIVIRFGAHWYLFEVGPVWFTWVLPEIVYIATFALAYSTGLAILTYSILTWYVWHHASEQRFQFRIFPLMLGMTWLSGYAAAWRASVLMAIEQYNKLPVEEPNCFICTASARGHAGFVNSFEFEPGGKKVLVTRQLQRLKAAELAFQVMMPNLHRAARFVYNALGPSIARRIQSSWVADGVFVLLKFIELPAVLILRLLGIGDDVIRKLYSN